MISGLTNLERWTLSLTACFVWPYPSGVPFLDVAGAVGLSVLLQVTLAWWKFRGRL